MALTLDSEHVAFSLDPVHMRWSLHALPVWGPYIEAAGMGITWRSPRGKHAWSQGLLGRGLQSAQRRDSAHGPLEHVTVVGTDPSSQLGLKFEFAVTPNHPLFLWRAQIENTTDRPLWLDRVDMLKVGAFPRRGMRRLLRWLPFARRSQEVSQGALRPHPDPGRLAFFSNGWQSWSFAGTLSPGSRQPHTRLGPLTRPSSHNVTSPVSRSKQRFSADLFGVIGQRDGGTGILTGFLSEAQAFGTLEVELEPLSPGLRLYASGDGVRLDPGATFETDWACIQFVELAKEDPMGPYLDAVARENNARTPVKPPSGWSSWYYYFEAVTQADIEGTLRWAREHRQRLPLEVIQLDDGFEAEVGDWFQTNEDFSSDLGILASEIRQAGFRPGLWLAPFIAKPGAGVIRRHRDWILRSAPYRPANAGYNWDTFTLALDVSHPDVLEHVSRVIRRAVDEWGFDYLKLDFLYAGALPGVRHDPTKTRAQALRGALKAVRQAAGDSTTLVGCGCPLGPGVGIFDVMRVGPDVAPRWKPAYRGIEFFFDQEPTLPSVRNALRNVLQRAPMNRRWWINDPDCLILRTADSHLSDDEVQSLATVVSLSAGSLLDSDPLAELSEERLNWLARLLPPLAQPVRVLDWFEGIYPSRLKLELSGAAGNWDLVAILNWGAESSLVEFDPREFGFDAGLEYHGVDFWREEYVSLQGDRWRLSIPGHGVRLMRLQPRKGSEPAWLGDSFHVSQGGFIRSWQSGSGWLRSALHLGRVAKGTLWLGVPGELHELSMDGKPVEWERVRPGIYKIDARMELEASLTARWIPGGSGRDD